MWGRFSLPAEAERWVKHEYSGACCYCSVKAEVSLADVAHRVRFGPLRK